MLKMLELFSGYGGASFALRKAGIDFECVGFSDIKPAAIKFYELNHPGVKNYGDITKIDEKELPDFDLLTGGFPCQTFSMAGNRKGFEDTRGTMIYEVLRIADYKKPKHMLLENVKGILSHDNGKTIRVILTAIKNIGYDCHLLSLSSDDYGTPQTRDRVWFVCKLGEWDFNEFKHPLKCKLQYTVSDLLEKEVDEKYYLSEKALKRYVDGYYQNNITDRDKSSTILASDAKRHRYVPIVINTQLRSEDRPSMVKAREEGIPLPGGAGIITRDNGVAYTLDTSKSCSNLIMDFRYDEGFRVRESGLSETIHTKKGIFTTEGQRVRYLTPKECFRLMGFFNDEADFGDLSDSALYNLTGDGWELSVASKVLKGMFPGEEK